MRIGVFDIEADGLLYDSAGDEKGKGKIREISEVFCIAVKDLSSGKTTLFEPDMIEEALVYLDTFEALVAHNGLGYDLPALYKTHGWKYEGTVYDTLTLSQLRYPLFKQHSLKSWGERLSKRGIIKVGKIDYNNFDYYEPEMGEYCKQDVEVTAKVFEHLNQKIDIDADYVRLEHDILSIQTKSAQYGVTFDYEEAMKLSQKIGSEMDEIYEEVSEKLGYNWEEKEHKLKKDGTLSHHAVNLLNNLREDFPEFEHDWYASKSMECSVIKVPEKITLDTKKLLINKLLEFGWKPSMYTEKGTPQIAVKGVVCENLPEEFKKVGKYFVLKHRKSLIDGFFKHVRSDGKIPSEANTLGAITGRYTHKKIANFPAVRSLYGKEIRELFGVEEGRVQVGADLSGIEARILAHFMNDAEFTEFISGKDENGEDNDVHTFNKDAIYRIVKIEITRDGSKTFYYCLLYGGGDEKVGKVVGGTAKEGKQLKEGYFELFPGLKKTMEDIEKTGKAGFVTGIDGRPIQLTKSVGFNGKMQYDVRKGLNSELQGSAAIYFKRWLWFIEQYVEQNELDAKLMISYHDEVQYDVHPDDVEQFKQVLQTAVESTDMYYKVNCPNAIEIKTGKNWHETH